MDNRMLKRKALDSLKGKWPTSIGAYLIFSLLVGGTSSASASAHAGTNYNSYMPNLSNEDAVAFFVIFIAMLFFFLLLSIALTVFFSPVLFGYRRYNLELAGGQKPGIKTLFSLYKGNLGRAFCLIFLRGFFVSLWTLLFIVPGIIASYRYAMADYLMTQDSNLSAMEAIKKSKQMMHGHKMELFLLHVSFIGWILLGMLTCGIGFLWISPYIEQTQTQFFLQLSQSEKAF